MLMNKININKIIIFSIIILGCFLFQPVLAEEATSTPPEPEPVIILGCMDSSADNYNSEATEDDNSCTYPEPEPVIIQGCTDSSANNYNPEATENDNSCTYPEPEPVIISGCTDSSANNYNPEATESDNSCIYPEPTLPEPEPEPLTSSDNIDNNSNQSLIDELKQLINSGLQTQQNQINQLYEQNQLDNTEEPASEEPAFDSAIAPSKVTVTVLMPDGTSPSFPVFVTFVGVGNRNFGGKIEANGRMTTIMPQGRYYTELMVVNTKYVQGESGPAFILESNEERDLGIIRLALKSEKGQTMSDSILENNLNNELEAGNKGLASILSMIVKLLMQILEELRSLTSYIMSGNN